MHKFHHYHFLIDRSEFYNEIQNGIGSRVDVFIGPKFLIFFFISIRRFFLMNCRKFFLDGFSIRSANFSIYYFKKNHSSTLLMTCL